MRTSRLALTVVVLSGLPSVGDSFVPTASDQWLMNQTTSFQLLAKGYQSNDLMNDGFAPGYITIRISIRNHSNKDLQAMTGVLEFFDATGALVDSRGFDDVSVIKVYSTATRDLRMGFNPYEPGDVKLRNAQVSDLRTVR